MKPTPIIYNWEEYTSGPNEPPAERLHITLNPRGMLLLNRRAYEMIGRPAAAMLMYDRRHQAIGIRAAGPGDMKPFPLKAHPKGSHHSIQARPFCRHNGILPPEAVRFTEPELDRDGILILSLHRTEPVAPKKRMKRDE